MSKEVEVISPNTEVSTVVESEVNSEQDMEDDYKRVRKNLHAISEIGAEALETAKEVADDTEHPRAFEVVGQLLKQLTDSNVAILNLHKQTKEITDKRDGPTVGSGGTNIEKAVFVGSTAELQKALKGELEDDE